MSWRDLHRRGVNQPLPMLISMGLLRFARNDGNEVCYCEGQSDEQSRSEKFKRPELGPALADAAREVISRGLICRDLLTCCQASGSLVNLFRPSSRRDHSVNPGAVHGDRDQDDQWSAADR
jgi:hypothetical protein